MKTNYEQEEKRDFNRILIGVIVTLAVFAASFIFKSTI
jgi:hypothetical protein